MQSFKDILHSKDAKSAYYHWRLLSFFALDAEHQISLIGPCPDWFVKESPDVNPGANYLFGMVALFTDCGCWTHFEPWAPGETQELGKIASTMAWNRNGDIWTHQALKADENWQLLRVFAREVLRICGLDANPQLTPYNFRDRFEISWNDYRHYNDS